MPGARQKLAQILSTTFKDKDVSDVHVAHRCKTIVKTIEQWKEGSLVPNSGEWADLLQYISRELYMHTSLWRDAKDEETEERRDTIRALDKAQRIGAPEMPPKIGTNVGQKVKEAITQTTSSPTQTDAMRQLGQTPRGFARDGRVLSPTRPNGSMSIEAQRERRRFVKGLLLQRPFICIDGADGILAQLRTRFGVGINPKVVQELREEIQNEQQRNSPLNKTPKVPEKPPEIIPSNSEVEDSTSKDLQAAIELIRSALPDLHQFILTVDENTGETDVKFKIRKIVDGAIKIKAAK